MLRTELFFLSYIKSFIFILPLPNQISNEIAFHGILNKFFFGYLSIIILIDCLQNFLDAWQ